MSAFNQESQATPESSPASSNAFEDQLKAIRNESGEQKYDSLDKALDALKHSQEYIPELKNTLSQKDQELADLKAELEKRKAVEEVVEKLTAKEQVQQEITPQANTLDEQAVLNLMENYSKQKETQTLQQKNEASVSDALLAKFGDKTGEVLAAQANELGVEVSDLQDLSRKSPQAALKLFGLTGGNTPAPTATGSSVNISSSQPAQEQLAPPEKSLLLGASAKEQADYIAKVRESVHKKYDIQV